VSTMGRHDHDNNDHVLSFIGMDHTMSTLWANRIYVRRPDSFRRLLKVKRKTSRKALNRSNRKEKAIPKSISARYLHDWVLPSSSVPTN